MERVMPKLPESFAGGASVLVGLFIVIFGAYLMLSPSTSALKTPIKDQLQAIQIEDLVTAYSYTSKEFQKSTSLDAFKHFVNSYSGLRNNESIKFDDRNIKDGIGMVKATLIARGGFQTVVTYQLVKERKRWKIESMVLVPNSDEPIAATKATTTPDEVIAPVIPVVDKPEAATPAEAPAAAAKATPLSFEDPDYHYTLAYSAGWEYTRADRGITVFYKSDQPVNSPIQFVVQPLNSSDDTARQSVKQVIDMGENAIREKASDYSMIEDGLLPSSANKNENFHGRYVLYTYTLSDESYKQLQVVIFKSPSRAQYVIDYIAPAALFDKNLPAARAMIASFTIS